MNRFLRIHLLPMCAALVAAVSLGGCGSDDGKKAEPRSTATTASTTTATTSSTGQTVTQEVATPGKTIPREFSIRITAGAPTERTFKVKQGDLVTLRVKSSRADELHVHGYDKTLDLKPGKTVELTFAAKLVGAWEIELEEAHQPVGSLVVEPA